jgi:hypothetical protein
MHAADNANAKNNRRASNANRFHGDTLQTPRHESATPLRI